VGNLKKMGFFKCFKEFILPAKKVQADLEPVLGGG
jgi:hypothetical protein